MKPKEFEKMAKEIFEQCIKVLNEKNVEYARDDDKLSNFKKAAFFERTNPVAALRGMLTKHIVSIYDMIDDINHKTFHTARKWDEKIIDNINYLLLIKGLLIDCGYLRSRERSKSNVKHSSVGRSGKRQNNLPRKNSTKTTPGD